MLNMNPLMMLAELTRTLQADPTCTDALCRRADLLMNLNQPDEALADVKLLQEKCGQERAEEATRLAHRLAALYYERGRLRHASGNKQGAADDLRQAMSLNPELEKTITGEFENRKSGTCHS